MRLPIPILLCLWAGTAVVLPLDLSDSEAAERQVESLVADWRSEVESDPSAKSHAELASSLHALGVIERQMGKPEEARMHLAEALTLFQKHAPGQLPDAKEALALVLQDLGETTASEALLREVLQARRGPPVKPGSLSATLDHLALNLLAQGRYPEVRSLLHEAIETLPADDQAGKARLMSHLGRFHHTLGSHARAVQLFSEALALGFADPELRLSLRSQLALSQLRLGNIEQAIDATEAVADDARELLADKPLRATPYLNNLGALALSQGRIEEAVVAFTEALEMVESVVGRDHPGLIGLHNNLGVAFQKSGDLKMARAHLERAAELQTLYLPATHLRLAEIQRNLAVNAFLDGASDAADTVDQATQSGLDLLDRLVTSGTEKERLNFLEHFDLTTLPCAMGDPERIANVLLASKSRLLDVMISGAGASVPPTWKTIEDSLPAGTAFVDFCNYVTLGEEAIGRYGAIIIAPGRSPVWIELGRASELHQWLGLLRERLNWNSAVLAGESPQAPPLKLVGILKTLDRSFWAPVESALPEGTLDLVVSPDGALHFLPFAALVSSEGNLLCHRFRQLTSVTSGRDLTDQQPLPKLEDSPWAVLTISDFPRPGPAEHPDPLTELLANLEPMPGTAKEAQFLREIAPSRSSFLKDEEATESAFGGICSPAVLHLGCHAFFLGGGLADAEVSFDFDEDIRLFQSSGLVLYKGALRNQEGALHINSDDILFPGEIARLSLKNTRLVTLSSCDSGAGTPINGEGLLGLKRAFAVAGAREIAVALWPISDQSTPAFMERFYELARHSNRPAQALWQTQRELIPTPDSPDFEMAVLRYAPFVLTQTHSIEVGEEIQPPTWGFNLWILAAAVPLTLFLMARLSSRIKKRSHPANHGATNRTP